MPKAEDGVTKEETGAAPERAKAGACTPSDLEIPLAGNNQQCEPKVYTEMGNNHLNV